MALIVTIGGANSDSYGTLSEAAAHHSSYGNSAWALIDSGTQEQLMRKAVRYIDSLDFKVTRATSAQALLWPCYGMDSYGYAVDSSIIPTRIKQAQFELALIFSTSNPLGSQNGGQLIEETLEGVGTFKYSENGNTQETEYPLIEAILKPYMGGNGGNNVDLVRT